MKMPEPVWKMTYSASRRKHHHRCRWCNRIIKDGETVYMVRLLRKRTYCAHEECGDRQRLNSDLTNYDVMRLWGLDYLAKVGWPAAKSELVAHDALNPSH